jgi:hypothetical protein
MYLSNRLYIHIHNHYLLCAGVNPDLALMISKWWGTSHMEQMQSILFGIIDPCNNWMTLTLAN